VFEHSSHPMHTALVQIVARPLRQAWQSVILGYVRFVVAAPIKIAGIVDYVESLRRRPVLEHEGLAAFATEVFGGKIGEIGRSAPAGMSGIHRREICGQNRLDGAVRSPSASSRLSVTTEPRELGIPPSKRQASRGCRAVY